MLNRRFGIFRSYTSKFVGQSNQGVGTRDATGVEMTVDHSLRHARIGIAFGQSQRVVDVVYVDVQIELRRKVYIRTRRQHAVTWERDAVARVGIYFSGVLVTKVDGAPF